MGTFLKRFDRQHRLGLTRPPEAADNYKWSTAMEQLASALGRRSVVRPPTKSQAIEPRLRRLPLRPAKTTPGFPSKSLIAGQNVSTIPPPLQVDRPRRWPRTAVTAVVVVERD